MFEESDLEVKNTKLHSKRLARELAMQYLFSCDIASELPDVGKFEEFYEESLKNEHNLSDNRYSRKSKEAAEELIVNVALNADVIDDKIREFAANWQWDRISVVERNILRIAVYEMLFVDDIPYSVTINEAVELSKKFDDEKARPFVNGVLNSIKNALEAK